ncbi:hypothetical protein JM93_00012 [Roseibium hamelinense]|uniref:Uncharacterized protein n=1 Tax=Roseibium hamelinense TaxID=150831 RepID=A0A562TIM3_9HYPH|nr:hypothetical protein JM93_00012 [Roseibium hamelinense]
MDGRPGPRPVEIGVEPFAVQNLRDLALGPPLIHEHLVNALDDQLFLLWAGDQDHTVGLQALLLAARQLTLRVAVLVDQHAPKPVPGRAALAISKLYQAALPGKYLHRKLTAVFAGHHAFYGLQQVGADAAVVFELLAAVVHTDSGTGADVFIVCALIGILKPTPAADVIDEDRLEVCLVGLDLGHQVLQRFAAVQP